MSARILLIEDDSAIALLTEHALRSAGFDTYTVDNGEVGLDLAQMCRFSLVITNIDLPGLSGHEVTAALRSAMVWTPVLFLTGYADARNKKMAFASGADDYMTKPFRGRELVARAHGLVNRGHTVAAMYEELRLAS